MSIELSISRNLKAIRLNKGISQRKLSDATGFEVRFISQIENKPRHLSTKTLERLAKGLEVSIIDLIYESDGSEKFETRLAKKFAPGIDESIRVLRILRTRIK